MATDCIFSIPGILAKVKRLFSSAKLMLPPMRNPLYPDRIEAGECIRSWSNRGLVMGDFEYLSIKERSREHFRRQRGGVMTQL